jgi:hypothetical protein
MKHFGAVALILSFPCLAEIAATSDLPDKNPCGDLDKEQYDGVRKDVKSVLDSKVIASINEQIAKRLEDARKKNPKVGVAVEIVKDWKSFQKMYNDDNPKTPLSDDDAKAKFDSLDAYTYTTAKDPPSIRVVLFCNRSFKDKVIDGKAKRVLVHELVHAKLYAMLIAGVEKSKLPFQENDDKEWKEGQDPRDRDHPGHPEDHNPDFHKEVEKLSKLL